ncbi:unnamed protein product [Calypogeia fissa]
MTLETKKKVLANEFLSQHLLHLKQGGPPPPPEELLDLLEAFDALHLPYLETWRHLKYPQFRAWFCKHVDDVPAKAEPGAEHHPFRLQMLAKVRELEDGVASCATSNRSKKKAMDLNKKLDSLRTVTSLCKDGGWAENGKELVQDAIQYMLVVEKHMWYHDFYKNPVEELHGVLQMNFLDWKFSSLGRERKKDVGIIGIAHWKQRLENLGIQEDDATARSEGRFSDAEKEESGEDEPYPAQVSPFRVKTAAREFARDNPKIKPEALVEWANGIEDEEDDAGYKLVIQGGKFDGSWQWEHKWKVFLANINNKFLEKTITTPPRKAGGRKRKSPSIHKMPTRSSTHHQNRTTTSLIEPVFATENSGRSTCRSPRRPYIHRFMSKSRGCQAAPY